MSFTKSTTSTNEAKQSEIKEMVTTIKEMSDSFGNSNNQVVALIVAAHETLKDRAISGNQDLSNIPQEDVITEGEVSFSAWGYQFTLTINQEQPSKIAQLADALGISAAEIDGARREAMKRHNQECDCEGAKQWRKENGYPDPGEPETTKH